VRDCFAEKEAPPRDRIAAAVFPKAFISQRRFPGPLRGPVVTRRDWPLRREFESNELCCFFFPRTGKCLEDPHVLPRLAPRERRAANRRIFLGRLLSTFPWPKWERFLAQQQGWPPCLQQCNKTTSLFLNEAPSRQGSCWIGRGFGRQATFQHSGKKNVHLTRAFSAKAALDAGYKLVIILAGMHNKSWRPNPDAVSTQGIIGFDTSAETPVFTIKLKRLDGVVAAPAVWPGCAQQPDDQQEQCEFFTFTKKTLALAVDHLVFRNGRPDSGSCNSVVKKPSRSGQF